VPHLPLKSALAESDENSSTHIVIAIRAVKTENVVIVFILSLVLFSCCKDIKTKRIVWYSGHKVTNKCAQCKKKSFFWGGIVE
jgi:hypothetical protein